MNKRVTYQKLIQCVIETVKNFNKRNDENSNEKINDQKKVMLKMFFIVVDFVDDVSTQIKIKNRKSVTNRFKKLLSLFNVHVELYLKKMTTKYTIVMNLNVLTKKMKHM